MFLMSHDKHSLVQFTENYPINDTKNKYLVLNVTKRTEDGRLEYHELTLYPNETLFYGDAWESHWCPYYNDREMFLTPRMNEFFHLVRSRGYQVYHLIWKGHGNKKDNKLRKSGAEIAKRGDTDIVRDTWVDNSINNTKYIPGFKDECIYNGYKRFGETRSQHPNPEIAISETDIIANKFKSVASIANAMHAKNVIMTGMHTNLCIRNGAMYLALLNISVGFVDDLLDSGYYYPGQSRHQVKSHTKNNDITYNYSITYHGWGINYFDLFHSLELLPAVAPEPKWVLFSNKASSFKRFYIGSMN